MNKPWYSIAAHIAYGVATALLWFTGAPGFASLLFLSYHIYQFTEYLMIKDKPYMDLREYYTGLCVGGLAHVAGVF